MTTPQSPQDPQDPRDLQDPTRPVEERPAASGTDDTALIEDDATRQVETAPAPGTAATAAAGAGTPASAATAAGTTAWAPSVAASPAPAAAEPVAAEPAAVAELPRPTGPHAPAIVLGVVCLAIAGLVIAQEVGSLKVDWGDVGPLGIVAAGAMLVLFGLLGLLTSRRNQR